MATIDYLRNVDGTTLYPVTTTKSVYDLQKGYRLDDILNKKQNLKECKIDRGNYTVNPWYMFASTSIGSSHCDRVITFLVQDSYAATGKKLVF